MKKKLRKETDEQRFDRLHPYPRWSGLVCLTKYVIGKYDGNTGFQASYLEKGIRGKTIQQVEEMCGKEILEIIKKEGGSSIGCILCNNFPHKILKQVDDSEDDTPPKPKPALGKKLSIIANASKQHRRIRMTYEKKNGLVVVREVACYSYKDGFVYVTDTRHGNGKIRSYKLDRIKKLVVMDKKFKSQWKIEF